MMHLYSTVPVRILKCALQHYTVDYEVQCYGGRSNRTTRPVSENASFKVI